MKNSNEAKEPRTSALFSPIEIKSVTLKNRIVVAPMWQYSGVGGMPTAWHFMHLGRLAAGGAALVLQEGTAVEKRGCGTIGDLGLWDDTFIEPLSRIVSQIKLFGSVPGIQLLHTGRKARRENPWQGRGPLKVTSFPDGDEWEIIGPSAIPESERYETPREMTEGDIRAVTQAWASATRRSHQAGYEAIEIHAAHGHLLHQFLSPLANQRGDRYGGSLENRCRFPLEVVEAVRGMWPDDKPMFVRISCVDGAGWSVEDSIYFAREMKALGVDVLDCSSGGMGANPQESGYCYQVPHSSLIRKTVGMKTMAVGHIVHPAHADRVIAEGGADLVAIGRELLLNPNWPIDAARKLGDTSFDTAPINVGYWLRSREQSFPGLELSTWQR